MVERKRNPNIRIITSKDPEHPKYKHRLKQNSEVVLLDEQLTESAFQLPSSIKKIQALQQELDEFWKSDIPQGVFRYRESP